MRKKEDKEREDKSRGKENRRYRMRSSTHVYNFMCTTVSVTENGGTGEGQ